MTSNLIVIGFDNVDDAIRARDALKSQEHGGRLGIQDAAVVVKDATGKVQVHGQASKDAVAGGVIGGVLGLLLAFMFPLAGIAIGAGAGALIGHLFDRHVDKKFVQDVQESLKPGTSALFVLLGDSNPAAVRAALEPFQGTLIQTTVDSEFEEELKQALK